MHFVIRFSMLACIPSRWKAFESLKEEEIRIPWGRFDGQRNEESRQMTIYLEKQPNKQDASYLFENVERCPIVQFKEIWLDTLRGTSY